MKDQVKWVPDVIVAGVQEEIGCQLNGVECVTVGQMGGWRESGSMCDKVGARVTFYGTVSS